MLKIIMTAFWLVVIVAFLGVVPRPYGSWLTLTGALLLIAHLIEYFVFHRKVISKGDGIAKGFSMTILFGLLYVR